MQLLYFSQEASSLPEEQRSAHSKSLSSTTQRMPMVCAWTLESHVFKSKSQWPEVSRTTQGISGKSIDRAWSSYGSWATASSEKFGKVSGTTLLQLLSKHWSRVRFLLVLLLNKRDKLEQLGIQSRKLISSTSLSKWKYVVYTHLGEECSMKTVLIKLRWKKAEVG